MEKWTEMTVAKLYDMFEEKLVKQNTTLVLSPSLSILILLTLVTTHTLLNPVTSPNPDPAESYTPFSHIDSDCTIHNTAASNMPPQGGQPYSRDWNTRKDGILYHFQVATHQPPALGGGIRIG